MIVSHRNDTETRFLLDLFGNLEGLRHSVRRLNDLEKENTELESDNHRLDRESKGLHKEIARLKQAIEVRPSFHFNPFQSIANSSGVIIVREKKMIMIIIITVSTRTSFYESIKRVSDV